MGKLRKFIASTAVVAILSSLVVTQAVFAAFSDVGADHWAKAAVDWGVTNECVDDSKDTFEVDKGANRAETAKLSVCLADLEGDGTLGSAIFSDSVAGAWYDTYLGVAYNNGVFTGDTGSDPLTVRPGAELNRAEAAKVILKAFDLPVLDGQDGADKFSDVSASDWFDSYLGATYCYENDEGTKILGGFPDGTAHPGDAVTKGAVVKMAYVAHNGGSGAVVSDDCSGAEPVEGDDDDDDADDDDDDDADDDDADDDDDEVVVPVEEGDLTVSLSDNNPGTTTLGDGTAYNHVLSVTLEAGAEGGSVDGITLAKTGLSTDSNVSGVSAWVGDTRYGNIVSVSEAVATLTFADPVVVPANSEVDIDVKINLDAAAESGTVQFGLSALDAGAGTVTGLDSTIWGVSFGTVDGGTSVGTLVVDSETYSTTTRNVKMGTENQPIAKFSFAAGANENLEIVELLLRNNGNSSDGDVTNLAWVDQADSGNEMLVVADGTTDKAVRFDFRDDPISIAKGDTETYILQGDVIDGSTRTTQFLFDNDYDVIVNGMTTGAGILPTAGANESTAFPVGDRDSSATFNQITGEEGSLSVSKDSSSASGNIGVGGKQMPVGTWKLEATGEDIEVRKVAFDLDNGDADSLSTDTNITGTVKLVKDYGTEDEATVYSIAATDEDLHDGVVTANTDQQFTMATYFTVEAGETATLTVLVDVLSTAAAGLTMQAEMANVYYKRLSSGTYNTAITTTVPANTLTSETPSVSMSINNDVPSGSIVAGLSEALVGSFNLQANSASGVSVQTIILDVDVTGQTAIAEVTNLLLKDHATGEQIGSTVSSPVADENSFNVSGDLEIAASETATVDVYANLSTAAATATATGTVQITTDAAADVVYVGDISNSSSSTGIAAAVNLQTMTTRGGGTLTVSRPNQTAQSVVHASETGVQMLAFTVESKYEDIKMDKIYVSTSNASGNMTNFTLKNTEGTTLKSGATVVSNTVTFSGLGEILEKDDNETYYVYADITNTGAMSSAVLGSTRLNGIDATGQSSGATIVETSSTTEIGSASSIGHYAIGDVVLDSQTAGLIGMVTTTAANDDGFALTTGPVGVLENGEMELAMPILATDYIAKLPVVDKWLVPAAASNGNPAYAVGDLIYYLNLEDADTSNGLCVITSAVTINTIDDGDNITMSCEGEDAAAHALAEGDRITRIKTGGTAIADEDADDLENAWTQGDIVWFVDDTTATNTGLYTVMDTFAAGGNASAPDALFDGITLTAEADDMYVFSAVEKDEYSTASANSYAAGEIVVIADESAGAMSEFYVIDENFAAGTSFAANTDITDPDLTLATDDIISKLWNAGTVGSVKVLHDTEPVVSLSSEAVSSGIIGADQKVAVFDIKADGPRDLYIKSVTLKCTGSYSTNAGVLDNSFKLYVDDVLKVTQAATSCITGQALTLPNPGTKVIAGQSAQFEIWYDTAATSGQASGESLQIKIDGTAGQPNSGGLSWYYTAADPSPGTEPTYATPTTYLDGYPVSGPTLTY